MKLDTAAILASMILLLGCGNWVTFHQEHSYIENQNMQRIYVEVELDGRRHWKRVEWAEVVE